MERVKVEYSNENALLTPPPQDSQESLLVSQTKNFLPPFDGIKSAKELIKKAYFDSENKFPWIIGFSGGKDSSFLLQLIFDCLEQFKDEGRKLKRHVHVVSSNTLVENPVVDSRAKLVKTYFEKWLDGEKFKNLFSFTIVEPSKGETFWINLIGRGYPAPNQTFRWCTARLKIDPINAYVDSLAEGAGGAITVLGVRKDESASRNKSISKHESDELYAPSPSKKGSYIFSPIKEVRLVEVWKYLLNEKPPWDKRGQLNQELGKLYQESSLTSDTGQCGFSIDGEQKKTCGSSRWGCWTCTLVERDKSIESFIWNDRKELQPLADYRNLLSLGRDDRRNRYIGTLRISKKSGRGSVLDPKLMPIKLVTTKDLRIQLVIPKKGGRAKSVYTLTNNENIPIERGALPEKSINDQETLFFHFAGKRYPSISEALYLKLTKEKTIDAFSEEGCGLFFVHKGKLPSHASFHVPITTGYTLTYRKKLLDELIKTQEKVGRELIKASEIERITEIWFNANKTISHWKEKRKTQKWGNR